MERRDDASFERILNRPCRGLGIGALKYLHEVAEQPFPENCEPIVSSTTPGRTLSLFDAAHFISDNPQPTPSGKKLGMKQLTALKKFVVSIQKIGSFALECKSPLQVIEYTMKAIGYAEHLQKKQLAQQKEGKRLGKDPKGDSIAELKNRAKLFFEENQKQEGVENKQTETKEQEEEKEKEVEKVQDTKALAIEGEYKDKVDFLKLFLQWLGLESANEDTLEEGKKAQERDVVSLTTIHQAKGLEWPVGKAAESLTNPNSLPSFPTSVYSASQSGDHARHR